MKLLNNFQMVNEPYECVMLLEEINNVIDTLSKLTDGQYYLDYIFNSSTTMQEHLKEIGIDEDYFIDTLTRFEKLRAVVFGDNIDWHGLVEYELRFIAAREREDNKNKEVYIRQLEHKLGERRGVADNAGKD